jgi:MerR family redox-sensitive transcriptional activator SoxR
VARHAAHLTIGQLAERSGVATSALRYYESRGLISSERTAGNQRRYRQAMLRRVAFIRSAQRVGLTLEEVEEALSTLPDGRTPTKADWARLSRSWRPRIEEQIERLERLRDKLDGCIGCGCLSLRTCSLNNPHDEVAPRGPGAVFLEPGGRPRR